MRLFANPATPVCVALVLLLAGCGGSGGGGGGGPGVADDEPIDFEEPDGQGTDGQGTDGQGTDGQGTDGQGTDGQGTDGQGTDGQGTDGQGTDGQGTDGQGTGGEDPTPGSGDVAVPLDSGRAARVLATQGGPVIGVPGATMSRVSLVDVHPAGYVVYTGSYRSPAQNSGRIGVWGGPAEAPVLLLEDRTTIEGFPETVRFADASFVDVASDGSIAAVASLDGSRDTSVLLVFEDGESTTLAETGTTLGGLVADKTVGSFAAVDRASGWTVFRAGTTMDTGSRGSALWLSGEDETTAIAETLDRSVNNAPRVGDCRVFLPSSIPRNGEGSQVLDDGTVVFLADLGNYTRVANDPCVFGNAVLRYRDGAYTSIVAPGDIVPGTTESTFTSIGLLDVRPSGEAIVAATLSTPTGDSRPDQRWSLWLFPPGGTARLIALQGEEVQTDDGVQTFPSQLRAVEVNDAAQVAFLVALEDGAALFGGVAHEGQPHAAISVPGASALTYLVGPTTTLPDPYLPSTFFSAIGRPAIDPSGQIVFVGRVTDSELNQTVVTALWRADTEGNLVPLIDESDEAPVSGVSRPLTALLEVNRFGNDNLQVRPLANGGYLLSDDRGSFNDSLIYLGPSDGG